VKLLPDVQIAACVFGGLLATAAHAEVVPNDVLVCEQFIHSKMATSPATYRRIDVKEVERNPNGERLIVVTYDTQNIYGALVRDEALCRFNEQNLLSDGFLITQYTRETFQ
jgi:hypothetical protein